MATKGKKLTALTQEGVTLKDVDGYGVIHLTHDGVEESLEWWAQAVDINEHTLYLRLRAGWSVEEALATPTQKQESHGASGTPEWIIWGHMKDRCNNPNNKRYKDWGGRGIKVLYVSFQAFIDDVGLRPTSEHTIERKNNDGHYEPGNCVWATQEVQCRNTRTNVELTHNGRTMILKDWAREVGLANTTLWNRLYTLKWSVERALTTPQRRRRS